MTKGKGYRWQCQCQCAPTITSSVIDNQAKNIVRVTLESLAGLTFLSIQATGRNNGSISGNEFFPLVLR